MKTSSLKVFLTLATLCGGLFLSLEAMAATYTAKSTGYYPHSSKMEGGYKDQRGNRLYTLQAYLRGQAPYVSVASDRYTFKYGTKIRILELEKFYGRKIEFRLVDNGGRFNGRGRGKIDICVESRKDTFHHMVNRHLTVTTDMAGGIQAPAAQEKPKTEITPVSGRVSKPVVSKPVVNKPVQVSQDLKATVRNALLENREVLNANPRDIVRFCQNYYNLNQQERADVWTEMILGMAQSSSQMNGKKITNQGRDSNGSIIYGRGLLQISSGSARGYRCEFSQATDLNNDETNIKCGIKIIERLIGRDDEVGTGARRGLGRYWGTFRESTAINRIKSRVSQISSCASSGGERVAGAQGSNGAQ